MNYVRDMGKIFSLFSKKRARSPQRDVDSGRAESNHKPQQSRNDFIEYPCVHQDAVTSVSCIDSSRCLSCSKDQTVVIFDFTTGTVEQKWLAHEKEVTKVIYADHLNGVFSCSRDRLVKLWQPGKHESVRTFAGHELVVTGLAVDNDNGTLCTGSRDNSLRLWDVETGQCKLQNTISRNLVTHLKWGKNADIIAQTSEDKVVRIWDPRTLRVAQEFPRKQYIQTCCDLNDDNTLCITTSNGFGGNGCEATLWDLRTTKPICEYKGHLESAASCTFLPSHRGRHLLATSSNDSSLRVWDQNTKECLCCLSISGAGPLTSIAHISDLTMAVGSFNMGVHIVSLTDGVTLTRKAMF
ncbi:WD repeat-containing protein 31-like [Tubulanus polymorphus]|uniref:WD repeat-containing protein 31-like n=1 Tax=Tubulanus polymorphus TaxID=672921 RepID=UPI003DA6A837